MGYVYFIQDDDAVKIGFSGSPECRISQFQTGNPRKLKLLGCIEGTPEMEKSLHTMMTKHRLGQGEWFDLGGVIKTLAGELFSTQPKNQKPLERKGVYLSRFSGPTGFYHIFLGETHICHSKRKNFTTEQTVNSTSQMSEVLFGGHLCTKCKSKLLSEDLFPDKTPPPFVCTGQHLVSPRDEMKTSCDKKIPADANRTPYTWDKNLCWTCLEIARKRSFTHYLEQYFEDIT